MQWEEINQWGGMDGTKAHLKKYVANRVMEGFIVVMLKIWKDPFPCIKMLGFVHV
jgi:hypothetical protein